MKLDLLSIFILLIKLASLHATIISTKKHFIVYMGHKIHPTSDSVINANHEIISSVLGSHEAAKKVTIHHYTKSFRGFSAMLTHDQAKKISESKSVISVFESKKNKLHTTHSWDFLNIDSVQLYNQLPLDMKSDVIVGVIDSGIWPESRSFNDYGLTPVPKRFRGKCENGEMFTEEHCNKKIIGARFYYKGFIEENGPLESFNSTFFLSPRDENGHSTHISSTIAGATLSNISLFGQAKGTARGGAPGARLAIYKACWFGFCSDSDLLAALDDAINDGVDVISMSLGPDPPEPIFFENAIAVGTFHAFMKGITVCASAGNSFLPETATNIAPWILTVAASTINREFQSNIYLGNSKMIKGFGLNPSNLESAFGLVSGSNAAASGISSKNASFCHTNSLDPSLIKGKIVVCRLETIASDRRGLIKYIRDTEAVGLILIDSIVKDVIFQSGIQATLVGEKEAKELEDYITSEKNPVASIYQTATVLPTSPAPEMASFSSKGPNIITPDIIKPDVTAPGVNILAAWSPVAVTNTNGLSIDYNIISGTSMSCPHVSAVAAIVKACHPTWSPAAIKSAIMTTARATDNTGNDIRTNPDDNNATPFDYGSGNIDPVAAIDPGLIYDFDTNDIIDFLCSNGANPAQLKNLTEPGQMPLQCKNSNSNSTIIPSYNFNYPSIGVSNMKGNLSVYRTVNYLGKEPTIYMSRLEFPIGVHVSVTPAALKFTKMGEKMSFRLDFTPSKINGNFVFGALIWSNGIHRVRSPIALNVLSV